MMSKIEQLISALCPDGVEHKPLSSIATISRGGSLQKKDFCESGTPCIHYGQIYTQYGLFTDRALTFVSHEVAKRQRKAKPGDIVMAVTSENVEDVCKCVVWLGNEDAAVSGHTAIISSNQNPKFLAYYFHSTLFFAQKLKLAHGTKVIEVTPDKLNDIIIPVPPIEVQREIVRILDSFTEFTEKLIAEITAEITARQTQYEYYRDCLMSFPEAVNFKNFNVERERSVDEIRQLRDRFGIVSVTIAEIAETNIGLATSVKQHKAESGVILLHNSDIQPNRIVLKATEFITEAFAAKNRNKILHTGDIITVHTGDVGTSAVITDEFDGAIGFTTITSRIKDTTVIIPEYLCNYLNSHACKEQIASMTISDHNNLNQSSFERIVITIPCLAEQERINAILRKMDILWSDILEGLPAEIEAQQKQYEYYRDKLMTFKNVQG